MKTYHFLLAATLGLALALIFSCSSGDGDGSGNSFGKNNCLNVDNDLSVKRDIIFARDVFLIELGSLVELKRFSYSISTTQFLSKPSSSDIEGCMAAEARINDIKQSIDKVCERDFFSQQSDCKAAGTRYAEGVGYEPEYPMYSGEDLIQARIEGRVLYILNYYKTECCNK